MLLNLLTIVVFLSMFSLMVAIHEWGHYLFARLFKMGVSEFSIGMGNPVVWTFRKKKYARSTGEETETKFNIRPLPLGGFVKIDGMEPQEDGSEVNVVDGFYSKSPWQRIVVLVAGPLFSILLGLAILIPSFMTWGSQRANTTAEGLAKDGAAIAAGLKPGDKILKVNETTVSDGYSIRQLVWQAKGEPVSLSIQRGKEKLTIPVTPKLSPEPMDIVDRDGLPTGESKRIPLLGVIFGADTVQLSLPEATVKAFKFPIVQVRMLLYKLTTPKQLVEQSSGVIGMVVITRSAVGDSLQSVTLLCALLSMSVGIFNLLPIGMLDGGQILIALIEMLRRGKRIPMKIQNAFFGAGMALLIILFLVVMRQDINRFVFPSDEMTAKEIVTEPKPQTTLPSTKP